MDDPGAVANKYVPRIGRQEHFCHGDTRRPRSRNNDLEVFYPALRELKSVEESSQDNDSGAMLVIVEHGNIEALLQLFFDLKAARSRNILEINSTKTCRKIG